MLDPNPKPVHNKHNKNKDPTGHSHKIQPVKLPPPNPSPKRQSQHKPSLHILDFGQILINLGFEGFRRSEITQNE
jgi:hypothetical protein